MAERLLFVDDDREFCSLMLDYLGGEGFEVSCVNDGLAALAALKAQSFDIVVRIFNRHRSSPRARSLLR